MASRLRNDIAPPHFSRKSRPHRADIEAGAWSVRGRHRGSTHRHRTAARPIATAPRLDASARCHGLTAPTRHCPGPPFAQSVPARCRPLFTQILPGRYGRMKRHQLPLFGRGLPGEPPSLSRPRLLEHGGDVRKGMRKIARPLAAKTPLHLVLRSSRATRAWSMLRASHAERIRHKAQTLARRCDVRLYRYANVGNHIHMLGQARSRRAFQSFLRAFAGVTARIVTGARRGRPVGRFWDRLAYTRIVSWGREFLVVSAYVQKNEDEARGLRPSRGRVCTRVETSRPTRAAKERGTRSSPIR
jgi:REP element-mobilizing transposase RayT